MVQQAFQLQSKSVSSYFEQDELSRIMEVYGQRVTVNEWRDYSIICAERATTVVVLDNGRDIASLSKLKEGGFCVSCENYVLNTENFNEALENFKTDFRNKKPQRRLTVVS